MLNINKQPFRIILIGLGSLLLIFAINIADKTETRPSSPLNSEMGTNKPSAFLTDSTFNIFDANGKLSKLHASKAFFYKDQDAIEIEQPKFSTNNLNTSILLTAKAGLYHPSNESLILEGNVIAKQTESKKTLWQLETNTLNIDNKTSTLFTSEAVNVKSGYHNLEAVGITASLNDRKIELLSKVRGKYVFE